MKLIQAKEQQGITIPQSERGFPIIKDTEHFHLTIDSNRTIWWMTKSCPDGTSITTVLGKWGGDPFMWGEYGERE